MAGCGPCHEHRRYRVVQSREWRKVGADIRIAVDLDGVCYEWQRTFCYMMREYHDVQFPLGMDWWDAWDACNEYTTSAQRKWMWSKGVELGLFRYGHMVQGTRIGLEALHNAGHKLVVVTHRPEAAVEDTLAWVGLYFKNIPLAGMSILSDGQPKTSVKADLLIDDKVENCVQWAKANRRAYLFDQPWNKSFHNEGTLIWRVSGWKGVVDAIH